MSCCARSIRHHNIPTGRNRSILGFVGDLVSCQREQIVCDENRTPTVVTDICVLTASPLPVRILNEQIEYQVMLRRNGQVISASAYVIVVILCCGTRLGRSVWRG